MVKIVAILNNIADERKTEKIVDELKTEFITDRFKMGGFILWQ